jgi:hypothetical protein
MEDDKEAVKTAEALAALESPTEEVKEQPVEETESAEKPVETPDESQEAPEEPKARAFQEQRKTIAAKEARIKELEEQLTTKSAEVEPEVGPLVPKIETPVPQGQVNQNQYFNQETGEFDADGYQNAVRADAMRAANEVTNQRLEEERQTQEAYVSYPELNPSSKEFDKDLYEATSALLLQSMVKGDKVTVKEATEKALGLSKKALKEAADSGAKQELENIAAKEKATLAATASSGRASSDYSDMERLSETTRQGGAEGAEALGERLKRGGF